MCSLQSSTLPEQCAAPSDVSSELDAAEQNKIIKDRFVQALQNHDLETMLRYVSQVSAEEINVVSKGLTALDMAASRGHYPLVEALLSHKDFHKIQAMETPTSGRIYTFRDHQSSEEPRAYRYHTEIVERSLKDSLGTALAWATKNGHADVVRLLLDAGAGRVDSVRALLIDGAYSVTSPPLLRAAADGSLDIAKQLLQAGATPKGNRYSAGSTPLIEAAANGRLEVVKHLIERGAEIDEPSHGEDEPSHDEYKVIPLIEAARNGHLNVVKYLVERIAEIDEPSIDKYTLTPFIKAAGNGHLNVVQHFIDAGANMDTIWKTLRWPANKGNTLAERKSANHMLKVLKHLLEAGAPLEGALCAAAASQHVPIVKSLLTIEGVDVNEQCARGRTPLWYATKKHDPTIVGLLMEAGANPFPRADDEPSLIRLVCDEIERILLNM